MQQAQTAFCGNLNRERYMAGQGHGEKLSRKQELAIAALLSSDTVGKAADAAGVAERTLRGWLQEPLFQDAYRAARRQVVEGTLTRLLALCGDAVDALKRNLTCGKPASEIRAALAVLEQTTKGLEATDLLAEIDALKRQLQLEGKSDADDGGEPAPRGGEASGEGQTAAGRGTP
jgi:hypothetical protein